MNHCVALYYILYHVWFSSIIYLNFLHSFCFLQLLLCSFIPLSRVVFYVFYLIYNIDLIHMMNVLCFILLFLCSIIQFHYYILRFLCFYDYSITLCYFLLLMFRDFILCAFLNPMVQKIL